MCCSLLPRMWNPFRSPLAASILCGVNVLPIGPGTKVWHWREPFLPGRAHLFKHRSTRFYGTRGTHGTHRTRQPPSPLLLFKNPRHSRHTSVQVLYLGAASGTTVSHVSDTVGADGAVYAVEFSHRCGRELLDMARDRDNVVRSCFECERGALVASGNFFWGLRADFISSPPFCTRQVPIIADARFAWKYAMLVAGMVGTMVVHVCQPDGARIAAINASAFLEVWRYLLAIGWAFGFGEFSGCLTLSSALPVFSLMRCSDWRSCVVRCVCKDN